MTTGVLRWADMRAAINLNTGFFETSQYALYDQMRVIAGNWDGAGQSAGNLQYNWGPADRLTEFYNHLLNNHDSMVRSVFGERTDLYDEFRTVNLTYTRLDKIAWGETITDYTKPAPDGHALIEPWKSILGDLMIQPESLAKYFEMMDKYYVPNALFLFKQLSCTSRGALASLFDLNINRGRFYPCNTLVVDFEQIDNDPMLTEEQKEAEKVRMINVRGNDPTNAMDQSAPAFAPRRDAMANLGGDYWGDLYDPEVQFDINLEPAIREKAINVLDVKLGNVTVENVYYNNEPVKSIYLGANLLGENGPLQFTTDTVPNTQFRTNSNSYAGFEDGAITLEPGQKLWIDIQNFVACRTYYTIDGSTPTENSNLYHEYLTFDESCTLKVLNVSLSGVAEPIRTLEITVPVGWRYVRFIGHGDQTSSTTRLVELQALEGATNRLLNKLPISGEAVNGGDIALATDGAIVHSPGYPLWWMGEGIPTLIYDMGDYYPIDAISVVGYSPAVDPRTTQFIISVSRDNVNWTQVIDYSANATNQPESGFQFLVEPLKKPSKPIVESTDLQNAVKLTWQPTTDTTSYKVYRATNIDNLGVTLTEITDLNTTTYTDTTAVSGTTYYYTVKAINYNATVNTDVSTNSDKIIGVPTSILVYDNRLIDFNNYTAWTVYGVEQATADFGNNTVLQGGDRLKIDASGQLRFELPQGMLGSANTGGIIKSSIAGKTNYTFEYKIRFDSGFPWSKGGKIPGMSGGVGYTGGTPAWNGDGFSVRIMWRENGRLIPYVYHTNQPDNYGDTFGATIGYLTDTKAYTIRYYVVLNTGANADGILKIYIDDVLAFEKRDIRYRTDNSKIDTAHIAIFAGGSTEDWNMTGTGYIRIDDLKWS